VPGSIPGREGFCIDRREFMNSVGVSVGDSRDCISDGAKKRDQERSDGGFRVISKTKATALHGVMGEEVRESRDVSWEICG
jgi:hypothetical protein